MTSELTRERTPDAHSNIVGGSTAARRIACPASYQTEQRLPPQSKDEESEYAKEGTALHEAIAFILDEDVTDLDTVIGREFYGVEMTRDLVSDGLVPCVDFIDRLVDVCEAEGGLDFELETRCEMLGIPGGYGTSDFVGRTDKRSVIIDWKFGAGVPVFAWEEVEPDHPFGRQIAVGPTDDDLFVNAIGNPQLMFYARAAMHTLPHLFEKDPGWPVELYIVQPRIDEDRGQRVSRFSTTVRELEEFRMLLIRSVGEALGDDPRRTKGPHCYKFAHCKVICPFFTGPALDLSAIVASGQLEKRSETHEPVNEYDPPLTDEEYADLLANILQLHDIFDAVGKEAIKLATAWIEEGNEVPGWALDAKRPGHDKWKDEKKAEHYLGRIGVPLEERRVVKTITPAVARKAAKALGKTFKEDYVLPGTSSGYTLRHSSVVKDPITFAKAEEIAGKLAALSSS
jgi:hypothetical protein